MRCAAKYAGQIEKTTRNAIRQFDRGARNTSRNRAKATVERIMLIHCRPWQRMRHLPTNGPDIRDLPINLDKLV
jgi:hypothetical protein